MKKILLCLLVIILLALGFAPTFFSSKVGKNIILNLAKTEGSQLSVETLHLSWFGPQKINQLKFQSQELNFQFESLQTESSLFSYIFGSPKTTKIFAPSLKISPTLEQEKKEGPSPTSLQKPKKQGFILPLKGPIEIENGEVEYKASGLPVIKFSDLNLRLNLDKNILFNGSCKTIYGSQRGNIFVDGHISPHWKNFQIHSNIEDLSVDGIEEVASFFKPDLSGYLTGLLGRTLNAKLDVDCCNETTGLFLQVNSPLLTASFEAGLQNGMLTLKKPALISFTVSPALLDGLKEMSRGTFTLNRGSIPLKNWKEGFLHGSLSLSPLKFETFSLQDVQLQFDNVLKEIEINSFATFIKGQDSWKMEAASNLIKSEWETIGTLKGKQDFDFHLKNHFDLKKGFSLTLEGDPFLLQSDGTLDIDTLGLNAQIFFSRLTYKSIDFENIKGEVRSDAKKEMFFAALHGKAKEGESRLGSFSAEIGIDHLSYKDPDLNQATVNASLQIKDGFTSALQHLFKIEESLPEAFGPTFNLQAELKSKGGNKTLHLKGDAREIQFEIPLTIKEDIHLEKGYLKWQLTKDAYALLSHLLTRSSHEQSFSLSQPGTIAIYLSSLSLPLKNPKQLIPSPDMNLSKMTFDLKASIDRLLFVGKEEEKAGINQLDLFTKKEVGSSLQYKLDTQVFSKEKGKVVLGGFLENFIDAKGDANFSDLTTYAKGNISHFPSLLLDIFYRTYGHNDILFSALLGPTVNAELQFEINQSSGPISLNIKSETCAAKINGKLSAGVFTLNEPISAHLSLTPDFSRYLLKDLNPLSTSAISAQKPFTFQIDSQNFSIPLFPFDVKNIQVGTASVDLGRIICQNDGNLGLIINLLKLRLKKEREIPLWFAPIVIHIQNGVVQCERTEILFGDRYDIATWGKIDLNKDRVNMTLGLTAQTLRDAFGIQDLPENYILKIPMKGKTSKVEINSTKATAKIAALMARQQTRENKGSIGLFGEVLGLIGELDDQSHIPPPKHPFPWEK